ncbi:hypothetical protein EJB05_36905 [Eragrostis curvula]|uniref:SPARK domain-containing protein n=1 Tax=Eragrostis curvula TaxID=38414 RepID=A0A5J9TZE5_9POAL|nr:hypothetical protein EJB05_36905 [Eragrostis curvula]
MLQSPNFSDVIISCATTLSDDITCKRCLNSGLSYLRHLVGEKYNITLNTCCDAAFVAFMSQGNISTLDTTSCLFTVEELSALQGYLFRTPSLMLFQKILSGLLPRCDEIPSSIYADKWDGAGELIEEEIIRVERNSGVISNNMKGI